jgi:hypothetical protein
MKNGPSSKKRYQQVKEFFSLLIFFLKILTLKSIKRARNLTKSFVSNRNNHLAIEMKFQKLKQEFFAAPSPGCLYNVLVINKC